MIYDNREGDRNKVLKLLRGKMRNTETNEIEKYCRSTVKFLLLLLFLLCFSSDHVLVWEGPKVIQDYPNLPAGKESLCSFKRSETNFSMFLLSRFYEPKKKKKKTEASEIMTLTDRRVLINQQHCSLHTSSYTTLHFSKALCSVEGMFVAIYSHHYYAGIPYGWAWIRHSF